MYIDEYTKGYIFDQFDVNTENVLRVFCEFAADVQKLFARFPSLATAYKLAKLRRMSTIAVYQLEKISQRNVD